MIEVFALRKELGGSIEEVSRGGAEISDSALQTVKFLFS